MILVQNSSKIEKKTCFRNKSELLLAWQWKTIAEKAEQSDARKHKLSPFYRKLWRID